MNTISTDLVALIKDRNLEGYSLLFNNYSPILYGSILRIVKDTKTAEILLKETIENIFINVSDYNPDRLTFLTWMLQMARFLSMAYLDNIKQQAHINNLNEGGYKPDLPQSIESIVMASPVEINDSDKIFHLILKGCKVNEVAEEFNTSVKVIKMNLHKGMKLTKKCSI